MKMKKTRGVAGDTIKGLVGKGHGEFQCAT